MTIYGYIQVYVTLWLYDEMFQFDFLFRCLVSLVGLSSGAMALLQPASRRGARKRAAEDFAMVVDLNPFCSRTFDLNLKP